MDDAKDAALILCDSQNDLLQHLTKNHRDTVRLLRPKADGVFNLSQIFNKYKITRKDELK